MAPFDIKGYDCDVKLSVGFFCSDAKEKLGFVSGSREKLAEPNPPTVGILLVESNLRILLVEPNFPTVSILLLVEPNPPTAPIEPNFPIVGLLEDFGLYISCTAVPPLE